MDQKERWHRLVLMPPPSAPCLCLHCKCWQWSACVSSHTEIKTHSVPQKSSPASPPQPKMWLSFCPIWRIINWIRSVLTNVLRHCQSSTRGCPAGRTAFRTFGPSLIPNRSFPISFIAWSTCALWLNASINCFWASAFLGEPSGALRNCYIKTHANLMRWDIFPQSIPLRPP